MYRLCMYACIMRTNTCTCMVLNTEYNSCYTAISSSLYYLCQKNFTDFLLTLVSNCMHALIVLLKMKKHQSKILAFQHDVELKKMEPMESVHEIYNDASTSASNHACTFLSAYRSGSILQLSVCSYNIGTD